MLGSSLSDVFGPSKDKRLKMKTNSGRSCSIPSLLFLFLGFQLGCFFLFFTNKSVGSGHDRGNLEIDTLREIEDRIGKKLDSIVRTSEERTQALEANFTNVLKTVGQLAGDRTSLGAPELERKGNLKNGQTLEGEENPAEIGEPACNVQGTKRKDGTVIWRPKIKRYLLAMCSAGQLSNRLACIRQSMLDAALLNRTLILPTTGIDYNYDNLLDLDAVEECFGAKVLISLDEYRQTVSSQVRVGRFICHVHTYQIEDICSSIFGRFEELNISFPKKEVAKRRTPGPWFKYPSGDFIRKFHSDHHLVAFGNMFGVGGRELRFEGAAPLLVKDTCRGFLVPSKAIQETAAGLINTYLGTGFMAVHLRRGDFFGHCLKGATPRRVPCWHPIRQVGRCLADRLRQHPRTGMVFLATNAENLELGVLRQALEFEGKSLPLVQMPKLSGQPWAEPLVKKGLATNPDVISLVDKTICALASVFFGTWGSTFTHDIYRMRDWWHQGSTCDGYICDPENIADVLPMRREIAQQHKG